jgi:hypothetical protein
MEASALSWKSLAWGIGLVAALVLLYYAVYVSAWLYLYNCAATADPRRGRLVRALFRSIAVDIDRHRAELDPDVLARSDARMARNMGIYGRKALGCALWLALLGLTFFLVSRL